MKIYLIAKLADDLRAWNVSEEIISFIENAPPEIKPLYVMNIRKNPQMTMEELQEIQPQEKVNPYLDLEMMLAEWYFGDNERLQKWFLVNLRKIRMRGGESPAEWDEITKGHAKPVAEEMADWVEQTDADIEKLTIEEAFARSAEWHREMAEMGAGKIYEKTNPDNIMYGPQWIVEPEAWNGWTIQRVTSPNDLLVEGNKMNHCVGSYADDVERGEVSIYSLRDPKNEPHVTMEVEGDGTIETFEQIQGHSNSEPKPEYKSMIREWVQYSLPGEQYISEGEDSPLSTYYSHYIGANDMVRGLDEIGTETNDYGMQALGDTSFDFRNMIKALITTVESSTFGSREEDYTGEIPSAPMAFVNLAQRKHPTDPNFGLFQLEKDLYELQQEAQANLDEWWDSTYLYEAYVEENPKPIRDDFDSDSEYQDAELEWEEKWWEYEGEIKHDQNMGRTQYALPVDTLNILHRMRQRGQYPPWEELVNHYEPKPQVAASNWYRKHKVIQAQKWLRGKRK